MGRKVIFCILLGIYGVLLNFIIFIISIIIPILIWFDSNSGAYGTCVIRMTVVDMNTLTLITPTKDLPPPSDDPSAFCGWVYNDRKLFIDDEYIYPFPFSFEVFGISDFDFF
jgi:hypothetical protein